MTLPESRIRDTSPPALAALALQSANLIAELQTPEGAYPASPSFSAYAGYCWFRDGSFIADAMSRAGFEESATRFMDWAAGTVLRNQEILIDATESAAMGEPVADERMFPARFRFDGSLGDDPWWDFQLDGVGTWLWALVQHARRHGLDLSRWSEAVDPATDYLIVSWNRPCYDWWEEHSEAIHVSSLGCVGAGLEAISSSGGVAQERAARASLAAAEVRETVMTRGVLDGHLVKWLGSPEVDGSLAALLGVMEYLPAGSEASEATIAGIERELTVGGGVHRFRQDVFFGGGQWPLLSCFLGVAHAHAGRGDRAEELLHWAASTADEAGMLPEQVGWDLLAPAHRAEWVERWGPVATPLLWSHAMFLRLYETVHEDETVHAGGPR